MRKSELEQLACLALGKMGEASSYADAKAKAVAKTNEILDREHKNQQAGW